MRLEGSVAIVTGGAGGLGSAAVRRLSGMGLRVAVFDLDAARAKELADEVGNGAVGVGGDVTNDDDVAAAIEAARALGPGAGSAEGGPWPGAGSPTRWSRSSRRWR